MNIYWCYDAYEFWGVYVIAETRGRAKAWAAAEMEIDYTDVRAWIEHKNVKEPKEGILEPGDPRLKKYKLEYRELEV